MLFALQMQQPKRPRERPKRIACRKFLLISSRPPKNLPWLKTKIVCQNVHAIHVVVTRSRILSPILQKYGFVHAQCNKVTRYHILTSTPIHPTTIARTPSGHEAPPSPKANPFAMQTNVTSEDSAAAPESASSTPSGNVMTTDAASDEESRLDGGGDGDSALVNSEGDGGSTLLNSEGDGGTISSTGEDLFGRSPPGDGATASSATDAPFDNTSSKPELATVILTPSSGATVADSGADNMVENVETSAGDSSANQSEDGSVANPITQPNIPNSNSNLDTTSMTAAAPSVTSEPLDEDENAPTSVGGDVPDSAPSPNPLSALHVNTSVAERGDTAHFAAAKSSPEDSTIFTEQDEAEDDAQAETENEMERPANAELESEVQAERDAKKEVEQKVGTDILRNFRVRFDSNASC